MAAENKTTTLLAIFKIIKTIKQTQFTVKIKLIKCTRKEHLFVFNYNLSVWTFFSRIACFLFNNNSVFVVAFINTL